MYTCVCVRVKQRTSPPPKKRSAGWLGQAQKKLREALRLKFGKKGKGLNRDEDPDREYKEEGDESDDVSHERGNRGRGRARGRGKGRGRGRGRSKDANLRKPPTVGPGGFDDEPEKPSLAGADLKEPEETSGDLKEPEETSGDLKVLEEKAKDAEVKVYQDMQEAADEKNRDGRDETEPETPTRQKTKKPSRKRATPKRKAKASAKNAKKRENEADGPPEEMTPRTKRTKTSQETRKPKVQTI